MLINGKSNALPYLVSLSVSKLMANLVHDKYLLGIEEVLFTAGLALFTMLSLYLE